MQCTFLLRAAVVLGAALVGVPVGAEELTHEAINQAIFNQDWQNN